MSGYRDLHALTRKLTSMTVDLQPPAFQTLPHARELLQRVLRAVFLPLAQLDGGAKEHAFWAVCAALLGYRRQEAARYQAECEALKGVELAPGQVIPPPADLDDAELVRIYRIFLAQHESRLNAEESAFLRSIGVAGVHLFNPDDKGSP